MKLPSGAHARESLYKKEMLRGRVLWPDANLNENFIFYVKNKHPLLQLYMSHPKHPMDRQERMWVLGAEFAIRFWISIAVMLHRALATVAIGVDEVQKTLPSPFAVSIIIALVCNVVTMVMSTLAVLDDTYFEKDSFGYQTASLVSKYAIKAILGVNAFVAIILGVVASQTIGVEPVVFAQALLISMVNSWTWTWLAIAAVLFFVAAARDKAFDANLDSKKHIRLNIDFRELEAWQTNEMDESKPLTVPTRGGSAQEGKNSGGESAVTNPVHSITVASASTPAGSDSDTGAIAGGLAELEARLDRNATADL
jgi:hypothetical protein